MRDKTCCFTGHRNISFGKTASLKRNLNKEITKLIKRGVYYYGSGGARGFDLLAAEAVLELKQEYPNIKLIMVLPCKDQCVGWKENERMRYHEVLNRSDKTVYVTEQYEAGCMHRRNRHLVDNSAYCICYLKKDQGGTAYTVNYARKNNLRIINLA